MQRPSAPLGTGRERRPITAFDFTDLVSIFRSGLISRATRTKTQEHGSGNSREPAEKLAAKSCNLRVKGIQAFGHLEDVGLETAIIELPFDGEA